MRHKESGGKYPNASPPFTAAQLSSRNTMARIPWYLEPHKANLHLLLTRWAKELKAHHTASKVKTLTSNTGGDSLLSLCMELMAPTFKVGKMGPQVLWLPFLESGSALGEQCCLGLACSALCTCLPANISGTAPQMVTFFPTSVPL